jgi:hypothetical protein
MTPANKLNRIFVPRPVSEIESFKQPQSVIAHLQE